MKEKTFTLIWIGIFSTLFFLLGWLGNSVYLDYKYVKVIETEEKIIDGLRFVDTDSQLDAIKRAQEFGPTGDWVCVDVKGMDFARAIAVCNHEVAHEIFATRCSENMTRCLGVLNG